MTSFLNLEKEDQRAIIQFGAIVALVLGTVIPANQAILSAYDLKIDFLTEEINRINEKIDELEDERRDLEEEIDILSEEFNELENKKNQSENMNTSNSDQRRTGSVQSNVDLHFVLDEQNVKEEHIELESKIVAQDSMIVTTIITIALISSSVVLFWIRKKFYRYVIIEEGTNLEKMKEVNNSSIEILKNRFAKGEITKKEFEDMKKSLEM